MTIRVWVTAIAAATIAFVAHAVTSVQAIWTETDPTRDRQRVYFANHCSHGDFILIWSALPPRLRRHARPVAGKDYWARGRLRAFVASDVFNAVLIARNATDSGGDPVGQMVDALDLGHSLILFPEGTRNLTDETLLPFKSGLYHLARARPDVDLVPVWIENLNRVLPKGAVIPVPLMCKVLFGKTLRIDAGETKEVFLARARDALLALRSAAAPAP